MNMFSKCFLLLAAVIFVASPAYSLSTFSSSFSNSAGLTTAGSDTTQLFQTENYTYIDLLIESSAGNGTITTQYASKKDGAIIIDDPIVIAFAAGVPASVFAGGLSKHYVQFVITCTAGPCVFDAVFTAKGSSNR
jgi:hypothetical protein